MLIYERIKEHVIIKGAYGYDGIIEIPEEIEGYPVTELEAYAFSKECGSNTKYPEIVGELVKEIYLPATIKKIGKYAFYNCIHMEKLHFYSTIEDIGTGVFTGCRELHEIEIQIQEKKRSCLKEVLSEIPNYMVVWYLSGGKTAKLIFPEYFEEAVENTPARILMTQTHGCGHRYRYCFQQTIFQFREYDQLFSYTRQQETKNVLLELALGRLWYPVELSEKARENYAEYIKKNLTDAIERIGKAEDIPQMAWLAKELLLDQESCEQAIKVANKLGKPLILSILMEHRHTMFPQEKKRFEL